MKIDHTIHLAGMAIIMVLAAGCSDDNGTAPAECTAGAIGCACLADTTCNDGLRCFNATCIPDDSPDPNPGMGPGVDPNPGVDPEPGPNPDPGVFAGFGLTVADESARSCEAVVLDEAQLFDDVLFDDTLRGRSMRRGKHLALAFVSTSDATIPEGAVSFLVPEGADDAAPTVLTARCWDAQSAELIGDAVGLVDKR